VQLLAENPGSGRGLAVAFTGTEVEGTKEREMLSFLRFNEKPVEEEAVFGKQRKRQCK